MSQRMTRVILIGSTLFITTFLFIIFLMFSFHSFYHESNGDEVFEGTELYRYLQINPENPYERSTGFVELPKKDFIATDQMFYTDDSGKNVLISKFGTNEYQCRGYCYRVKDSEDDERRAISGSMNRGVFFLVAAISSFQAYQKAKSFIIQSCKDNDNVAWYEGEDLVIDHERYYEDFLTPEDEIGSVVEECWDLNEEEEKWVRDEEERKEDGILEFYCEGLCSLSDEAKPIKWKEWEVSRHWCDVNMMDGRVKHDCTKYPKIRECIDKEVKQAFQSEYNMRAWCRWISKRNLTAQIRRGSKEYVTREIHICQSRLKHVKCRLIVPVPMDDDEPVEPMSDDEKAEFREEMRDVLKEIKKEYRDDQKFE